MDSMVILSSQHYPVKIILNGFQPPHDNHNMLQPHPIHFYDAVEENGNNKELENHNI